MKQSERINLCKIYNEHPLKGKYETERKTICSNKPSIVHLVNLGYVFFLGMFILYGYLFFSDTEIISDFLKRNLGFEPFFGDLIPLIGLGIGNIILGLLYAVHSVEWKKEEIEIHNKKALNSLDEKYKNMGLIPMPESELFKHPCCEYDEYREKYVCSATGQPLKDSDFYFCNQSGKCRYCKAFVSAYLGPQGLKYWGFEFEK